MVNGDFTSSMFLRALSWYCTFNPLHHNRAVSTIIIANKILIPNNLWPDVTLPNYRIYAQFGRLPSLNNYIKSTAAGLDYYQELLIEGSANIFPGTWYYGVYGLGSAISYTVTASFESYCPRNCSGHGVCGDNFQCICEPPYISDDCSSRT